MSKLKDTHVLTIVSMLVAMAIVLSYFKISITQMIEIRFQTLPIALSAYLFGPGVGGIVGILTDVIGYIIRPTGPYFPGFTLSSALGGVIYGFILYNKKVTWKRVLIAQLVFTVVIGMFINTLNLSILYGTSFQVLFISRLPKEIIMYPINVILLMLTTRYMSQIPFIKGK